MRPCMRGRPSVRAVGIEAHHAIKVYRRRVWEDNSVPCNLDPVLPI